MVHEPDIAKITLPGITISHCRLPAWECGDYISRSAPSSIGVSFTGQECEIELGGRTLARAVRSRGVVVTGAEAPVWLRVDQSCELLEVSAATELRVSIAGEYGSDDRCDLADLNLPEDPVSWALSCELRRLAREPDVDEIEVEILVRLLYARILAQQFGGRPRVRGDGGLDGRRLARVIDYIDAHLGDRMSLAGLADVAALSPFHFHRSFKRTVGCTLHRFVALRRLERAGTLLIEGRAIPDVARTLRYSSAASLRVALARDHVRANL